MKNAPIREADLELATIKRVLRELERLPIEQRVRVVEYVSQRTHQEQLDFYRERRDGYLPPPSLGGMPPPAGGLPPPGLESEPTRY